MHHNGHHRHRYTHTNYNSSWTPIDRAILLAATNRNRRGPDDGGPGCLGMLAGYAIFAVVMIVFMGIFVALTNEGQSSSTDDTQSTSVAQSITPSSDASSSTAPAKRADIAQNDALLASLRQKASKQHTNEPDDSGSADSPDRPTSDSDGSNQPTQQPTVDPATSTFDGSHQTLPNPTTTRPITSAPPVAPPTITAPPGITLSNVVVSKRVFLADASPSWSVTANITNHALVALPGESVRITFSDGSSCPAYFWVYTDSTGKLNNQVTGLSIESGQTLSMTFQGESCDDSETKSPTQISLMPIVLQEDSHFVVSVVPEN